METIKQELKDFKEEIISRLTRIEAQTTKTNGNVAKAITDIALGSQERKEIIKDISNHTIDCPARKFFNDATTKRDWTAYIVAGLSSVITGIITVVVLVKFFNIG